MKCFPLLGLLASLAFSTSASAAIIVSGDPAGGGTLQITAPIQFTVTSAANYAIFIVLDDWVETDGSQNAEELMTTIPALANGSPLTVSESVLYDNFNLNGLAFTSGDGLIVIAFEDGVQPAGTVITVPAGVWSFGGNPDFNPQSFQTFTGNAFLTDTMGNRVSDNVSLVPEMSSALLGVAGLLVLLKRRR
jgi:hypothetical protein